MANLKTKYMGLELDNPVVIASSSLSKDISGIKSCEKSGAGAIVLKSLFEEQILSDTSYLEKGDDSGSYLDSYEYVHGYKMALGPMEYIQLVKDAKKAVNIPIIASLNCISPNVWSDYAHQLESAGADALELNISFMPGSFDKSAKDVENLYFEAVKSARDKVKIPISVKVGPYFSSFARFASKLSKKIDALVLFNRFYQLDIDINDEKLKPGYRFSTPDEIGYSLRWIAHLTGQIDCDLAATTGIHDGEGAIKQLLAGANVVQLCSTLYLNKLSRVEEVKNDIAKWMDSKGYKNIDEFRGKLSRELSDNPELYDRLQYIKALVGID